MADARYKTTSPTNIARSMDIAIARSARSIAKAVATTDMQADNWAFSGQAALAGRRTRLPTASGPPKIVETIAR